jgi:hypothetical protein
LNVKDDLAGKKIRCPDCKSILAVPQPEDLPLEVLPADEPEEASVGRKVRRAAIQAEPPERPPARRRSDDDDPPLRKRRKPRREIERRTPLVSFERGWFGSVNAGVAGGILMIVIAVVWFIGGLAAGYIFFYPPILLVVGLIAIVKGGLGGN